jgi:nicotinate-nucleotide pyrophosphorylase (carboxylating)
MKLTKYALREDIERYFKEDDLARNISYLESLPDDLVQTTLHVKSDMVLSGLPWFSAVFDYLGSQDMGLEIVRDYEGLQVSKGAVLPMGKIPFSVALTGERLALNLLQRASNISTFTSHFVEKAKKYNISILDTRKTTPGLRSLEKYAVVKGGGHNHRFGQGDMWMIKDNHKTFFGGVKEAIAFFKETGSFYTPVELEVHNVREYEEAKELQVRHVMLDNFNPDDIKTCLSTKPESMTIELSGGITLDNLDDYLIEGVDAISVGALTYNAPAVDLSFKYQRL